jgi:hypothetical protein
MFWGRAPADAVIICNGRSLKMTSNLERILRKLRHPEKPRQLWADSICINQQDIEEKSRQVAMMSQIYRKSTRVGPTVLPSATPVPETEEGFWYALGSEHSANWLGLDAREQELHLC